MNADDRSGVATTNASAERVDRADGFDGFYAGSHDDMVRALCIAVGHTELGRDAAAEAFTRALQRWDRVSTLDNPAGWTYRVGLNWARSRQRKFSRERYVDADPGVPPIESDPGLTDALGQLSADHRAVVVGRFYLDWSEAELAAALDIPAGTVKSRLHRALEQLSGLLEEDFDG